MLYKIEIRQEMLARRLAMNEKEHAGKSARICETLSTLFFDPNQDENIGLYYPIKKEVDLRALPHGFFPKTVGDKCVYFPSLWTTLKKGSFGVPEPETTDQLISDYKDIQPGIILVPGIAFSTAGHRIGFGRGYFDRTLKEHPQSVKIGVAFEFQIVDAFKTEPWDVPMDFIVTEARVIGCQNPKLTRKVLRLNGAIRVQNDRT